MITTMFTALWLLSLVLVCTQVLRFVLLAILSVSDWSADILTASLRQSNGDRAGVRPIQRGRHAISSAPGALQRRAFEDECSLRLRA